MITKYDLGLTDDDLVARVLAYGRVHAPCLDEVGGQSREDIIAVLRNVAAVAAGRLPGLKKKAVGDWSWEYLSDAEMGSMIGADDRAVLAGACGITATPAGGSLGCFPPPPSEYRGLWRS